MIPSYRQARLHRPVSTTRNFQTSKSRPNSSSRNKSSNNHSFSQNHTQPHNKTQQLININPAGFSNVQPIKEYNPSKPSDLAGMNYQEIGRFKRQYAKITNKSVEELYQQNMHLKRDINRLGEELAQIRSKFQVKSKRNQERVKQLDLEFEKQLYWTGNSKTYLISGIKFQYQKLTKAHQELKKQYDQLKKAFLEAKVPQLLVHCQSVQQQNNRLVQKLRRIQQKTPKIPQIGANKKAISIIIQQLEQKVKKLEQQIIGQKQKYQTIKEQLHLKDKKIQFLQKLLIQKDNSQYHYSRRVKKLQKLQQQHSEVMENHKRHYQQLQKIKQDQKKEMLRQFQLQKQKIRQKHKKQTDQLKHKIENLLEDNRELENNVNKFKGANSMMNSMKNSNHQRKNSVCVNSIHNSNTNTPQNMKVSLTIPIGKNIMVVKQDESFQGYQSDSSSNVQVMHVKKRQMKKADKKHSLNSKKVRKVAHSQVTQIAQLIKYRMISTNTSIQQMKKYFNATTISPNADPSTPTVHPPNLTVVDLRLIQSQHQAQRWQQQHITMKQCKEILEKQPFCLDAQSAFLMARYLIEDCNQDFVYCDEENENMREIIKSILKALVGDYQLPDQQHQGKVQEFFNKFLQNFMTALKTYHPNGKVSKKKFMQLLNSIDSQLSQKSQEIILAKVAKQSKNLNELQYGCLQKVSDN